MKHLPVEPVPVQQQWPAYYKTENEVTVHLLGGDLKIRWDREANQVYMTGPATVVFDGEITLPDGIA